MGLNYVLIYACKCDFALFWGESKGKKSCPMCDISKLKYVDKKILWKVLRYFPIKPKLKRLFMFKKMADDMWWHKKNVLMMIL